MPKHSRFSDSAGVPWQGRRFNPNPWETDDGSAPPQVAIVIGQIVDGLATVEQLVERLPGTRLLVPLLAEIGESETGPHGHSVDKSAELSIVAVATPDGETAIPAFTDVGAMTIWNPKARPVPVPVEKLSIAAVGEGHSRVIVNPASAAIALRRIQLRALALGSAWERPDRSREVARLVADALHAIPEVQEHNLLWLDWAGKLTSPELQIELLLSPGVGENRLQEMLTSLATDLSRSILPDLVDSFGFKLTQALQPKAV